MAGQNTKCRILLVEDHEDTRQILARLLGSLGHEVVSAGGLAEAIAAAHGTSFDLVVSDIALPDGTGMDLMEHMNRRRVIPGIALSGFGQEEDIRRSRIAGFNVHLVKPVELQTLEAAIARLAPPT